MSQPVRLLVSSLVEVPMVIGWLRPVILVPIGALTGLPPEHVTALLAHELAHILRRDYIVAVLQSVAEALLFYHPAVWWISGQIRAERELCCDDLAVAASGDVLIYARALAELESIQPSRLPALAANGGSLVHRIRRLIEPAQSAVDALPGAVAAWAMVLLWVAGLGVVAAQASQPHVRAAHRMEESPVVAVASARFTAVSTPDDVAAPTVMSGLASHARKTLLFDPFLAVVREAPKPVAVITVDESSVPPFAETHALQNPLGALAGSDMKLVAKLQTEPPRKVPLPPAIEHIIRSTTHLVQTEVTVRDSNGPVRDLAQSDFELFDNGVPQKNRCVRCHSRASNAPDSTPAAATVMLIDRIGARFEDDVQLRSRIAEVLKAMPANEPVSVVVPSGASRRANVWAGGNARQFWSAMSSRSGAQQSTVMTAHSPNGEGINGVTRALSSVNRVSGEQCIRKGNPACFSLNASTLRDDRPAALRQWRQGVFGPGSAKATGRCSADLTEARGRRESVEIRCCGIDISRGNPDARDIASSISSAC